MKIDVLVGCEESGAVTMAFRSKGINAWSCDLLPTSGNLPQYHIVGDVLEVIKNHPEIKIGIFFPPCTHLAVSGAMWFPEKRKDGRQQEAIDFFMALANAPIRRIAIENPVGIMNRIYKPPTQIIQPYMFGDRASKKTCLWLKNLPRLYHNATPNLFDKNVTWVDKGETVEFKSGRKMPKWYADAWRLPKDERSMLRSKTFQGIANAMSNQWSVFVRDIQGDKQTKQ